MSHLPFSPAAVIFDFDGVLADSEPLHERAILEVIRPFGWTYRRQQFVDHIIGLGDEATFALVASWHGASLTDARIAELCDQKTRAMAGGIHEGRFAIKPGAAETVRAARARGPVAVCSGSRRDVVVPMLERMGLLALMTTVVTHDEVAAPKPDPEGYLLAAERLGADPARCVVIEDSPTGIRAARGAGMFTIGVCHSFPAERLTGASLVLPAIADAVPLIAGAGPRA